MQKIAIETLSSLFYKSYYDVIKDVILWVFPCVIYVNVAVDPSYFNWAHANFGVNYSKKFL